MCSLYSRESALHPEQVNPRSVNGPLVQVTIASNPDSINFNLYDLELRPASSAELQLLGSTHRCRLTRKWDIRIRGSGPPIVSVYECTNVITVVLRRGDDLLRFSARLQLSSH